MTAISTIRKTIICSLTVAIVATAAVSGAEAGNRHHGRDAAVTIGVIGIAAALLGATNANAHQRLDRGHGRGYGHHDRSYGECFDKPIRRWDSYERRRVVVGYKTVCR